MTKYKIIKLPLGTFYYVNNVLHREEGPAIEYSDGYKAWYVNGEFHREDGPAIEHPNGYKAWYVNGEFHREDGPAIEHPNGYKAWFLNGSYYGCNVDYTNESWIKFIKTIMFL